MHPQIDKTTFGSITVDGETFNHDIVIRLDGKVTKRKKTGRTRCHWSPWA